MKCSILQKIINSPGEKENSSMCLDMNISKTISSPIQSSSMVILFYDISNFYLFLIKIKHMFGVKYLYTNNITKMVVIKKYFNEL